jgi:hypothetical protein
MLINYKVLSSIDRRNAREYFFLSSGVPQHNFVASKFTVVLGSNGGDSSSIVSM